MTAAQPIEPPKPVYLLCTCGHVNSLHAGWLWTCGIAGCGCKEFAPTAYEKQKREEER